MRVVTSVCVHVSGQGVLLAKTAMADGAFVGWQRLNKIKGPPRSAFFLRQACKSCGDFWRI